MRAKIVILLIFSALILSSCQHTLRRYDAHHIGVFDTWVHIVGYAENQAVFNKQAQHVFDKLEELHKLFDIHQAHDDINNLYLINRYAGIMPIPVDPLITELLALSKEAYDITYGTMDITLGHLIALWKHAETMPTPDEIQQALRHANINNIVLENNMVFLSEEGMMLDVGSIAKGFAAALALQSAIDAGLDAVLLSVGGHVVTHNPPPGRTHWNVGIRNPDINTAHDIIGSVQVRNKSVSVSGNSERFLTIDGIDFGHIINPASGAPANTFLQVTVIHEHSWMADALSTALFILPFEDGMALAQKHDAEAMWIFHDKQQQYTNGFLNIFNTFND